MLISRPIIHSDRSGNSWADKVRGVRAITFSTGTDEAVTLQKTPVMEESAAPVVKASSLPNPVEGMFCLLHSRPISKLHLFFINCLEYYYF